MAAGYTLTATLEKITGDAAGSAPSPAKLLIVLCGFGLTIPVVVGTAVVAQRKYEAISTGSAISQVLWGNDVISPANTWYSISVIDGHGNVEQTANYLLTGSGGDLSSLVPFTPVPPTPPSWMPWIFVTSVAGVLTIPASAGRNFWTILHENVTSVVVSSPTLGQDYWFFFEQDGTGNWTVAWGAALLNPIDPVNPVPAGFTLQPAKCLPTGQLMNAGYYP